MISFLSNSAPTPNDEIDSQGPNATVHRGQRGGCVRHPISALVPLDQRKDCFPQPESGSRSRREPPNHLVAPFGEVLPLSACTGILAPGCRSSPRWADRPLGDGSSNRFPHSVSLLTDPLLRSVRNHPVSGRCPFGNAWTTNSTKETEGARKAGAA